MLTFMYHTSFLLFALVTVIAICSGNQVATES